MLQPGLQHVAAAFLIARSAGLAFWRCDDFRRSLAFISSGRRDCQPAAARATIMKTIPQKNWRVGAVMFLVAAACFGGAAIIYAKSSKPSLAVLNSSLAVLYLVLSALFYIKCKLA